MNVVDVVQLWAPIPEQGAVVVTDRGFTTYHGGRDALLLRLTTLGYDARPLGAEGIVTTASKETEITVDGVALRSVVALRERKSDESPHSGSMAQDVVRAVIIALVVRCVLP